MASTKVPTTSSGQLPDAAKLIIGAGGIYAAFLYYGTLQEDVFHYVASDGSKFKAAWFLQTLGMFNAYFLRHLPTLNLNI